MAKIGLLLVKALPYIIKVIGVIGTIALLLVSGGIFVHHFHFLHSESLSQWPTLVIEFAAGLVAGLILVVFMKLGKRMFQRNAAVSI
jgi:predicted DNA repair protein MutK